MTYIVRCSPLDKGKHIDILKIMYLHIRFYKKEKKMSPIGNSEKSLKRTSRKFSNLIFICLIITGIGI